MPDPRAAAGALLAQYGEDAEVVATLAAAEAAAAGDIEALSHWDSVIALICGHNGEGGGRPAPC